MASPPTVRMGKPAAVQLDKGTLKPTAPPQPGHPATHGRPSLQPVASRQPASMPSHDVAAHRTARANISPRIAILSGTQLNGYLSPSRTMQPSAQPSVSKQTDTTTRVSSTDTSTEQAALRDWAAQQRRATVKSRTSVPATQGETKWTTHMAYRRIRESADAFQ